MDATTQRYHLLILALESRVLKRLARFHKQAASIPHFQSVAHREIIRAQMQAHSLGGQLGITQLENELPDEQEISRAHYAPLHPVHIHLVANKDKNLITASTVARTAIIEAFRQAAIAVYATNQIDGWIWDVEGEDPCDWCLSMDGTVHPLTEKFESHDNCKCGTRPHIAQ